MSARLGEMTRHAALIAYAETVEAQAGELLAEALAARAAALVLERGGMDEDSPGVWSDDLH